MNQLDLKNNDLPVNATHNLSYACFSHTLMLSRESQYLCLEAYAKKRLGT